MPAQPTLTCAPSSTTRPMASWKAGSFWLRHVACMGVSSHEVKSSDY